ncbi:hypothetical protein M885DRAFT_510690 [Pelagophyceae sp. CCMP2097]|nr:hypothetical protein M885DRAFT_510690 [Pelagophyceae sp. CCMP2097]|mmetsp:Transcript_22732/g.76836  ORF Transcript_22732/g.76836 Transcript_22732/m.76836 type:complete len:359 (+) Transcript_22732:30-1106(+)
MAPAPAAGDRQGDVIVHSNSCVFFIGGVVDGKASDFRRMGPKVHNGAAPNSAPLLKRLARAAARSATPLDAFERLALDPREVPAAALGHRFLVTQLPPATVRGAADAAKAVVSGTRKLDDGLALPDATQVMAQIPGVDLQQDRVDCTLLLNEVLRTPPTWTVWALCADVAEDGAGDELILIQKGFEPAAALQKAFDAAGAGPLDELRGASTDFLMKHGLLGEPQCCFWCGTPPLSRVPSKCGKCGKPRYCSKQCQAADWVSFHKGDECRALRQNDASFPFGRTRDEALRHPERVSARLPFAIDVAAWDGCQLATYLCNLDADGAVCATTEPFPLGWHVVPRERWAYEKNKFSYAAPPS